MSSFVHLVARAYRLPVPLTDDAVAPWLWSRLEVAFPDALAAVLMPNHLHLIAPARSFQIARAKLTAVLGALARSGGVRRELRFEPVPPALLDDDPAKLLRQGRYLALNPIRAKLIDDPLAWAWSTHRDVIGAVARPWVTAAALARVVGRTASGFASWWHRYVAREEAVPRAALVLPVAARATRFPESPLTAIADAAASALRARPTDVRRRGELRHLFVALACHVGWDRSSILADFCGISPRAVQKLRRRAPPTALDAALLCLGDERLRR